MEVSSIQRSPNTLQYYNGTHNGVLISEVSSIQRSPNALQYYNGTQNGVLITEVSSIQRSPNTLQYYTGTQNGVLITEVSSIQRSPNTLQYYTGGQNGIPFLVQWFHCLKMVDCGVEQLQIRVEWQLLHYPIYCTCVSLYDSDQDSHFDSIGNMEGMRLAM